MEPNSLPLIKPSTTQNLVPMPARSQTFDLGPIQAHMGEREFVISQLKQQIVKLQAELAESRAANQSESTQAGVK